MARKKKSPKHAEKAGRTIYCTRFEATMSYDDLVKYFQHFGKITKLSLVNGSEKQKKPYCFVEFADKKTKDRVIARPHAIKGRPITVKDSTASPQPPPCGEKAPKRKEMKTCLSFDDQVLVHCENCTLSLSEAEERKCLVSMLQNALLRYFPRAECEIFGSYATGLGNSQSDLDIFLDFHLGMMEGAKKQQRKIKLQKLSLPDLPPIQFPNGKIYMKLFSELDNVDKCKVVARILQQTCKDVKRAFTIPSSRCPLVRVDTSKRVACDITLSNRLSLRNTKWIRLCMEIQPLFRPLALVVKSWNKQCQSATKGQRPSSYAFLLLLYVYFATRKSPLLPTVKHLKSLTDTTIKIGGCDCSFPESLDDVDEYRASSPSFLEALQGFFAFLTSQDYDKMVYLTRDCRVVPRAEFIDGMAADKYNTEFKIGAMNIQDPFDLSHNTTLNISAKMLAVLRLDAQTALDKLSDHGLMDPSPARDWGLMCLMNVCDNQLDKLREMTDCYMTDGAYYIPIIFGTPFLYDDDGHVCNNRSSWENYTSDLILRTLREILLIECSDVTSTDNAGASSTDNNNTQYSWRCRTKHRLWMGRKKFLREAKERTRSTSAFEHERFITSQIVLMTQPTEDYVLEFDLHIERTNDGLLLKAKPRLGAKCFSVVCNHLKALLARLMLSATLRRASTE